MSKYKSTIVIPTRDRHKTAYYAVINAVNLSFESQILVVDSSNDDILHEMLYEVIKESCSRVKYVKTSNSFNVVENFEYALEHCEGEYICYIGDDDLIGPKFDYVVNYMIDKNVDCACCYGTKFNYAYYWPGVKSKYFGDSYSKGLFKWSETEIIDSVNILKELHLTEKNIGFGLAKLPRIYHGLVSKELIDTIKTKYGKLFGGVSPDIYSSVLISLECKNPKFMDIPFCIPGASPQSEAGSGAARSDRTSFEDSPYLKKFKILHWNNKVPKFFSPFNVWGFSMLEAYKVAGIKPSIKFLTRLYARCLLYCPKYYRQVFASFSSLMEETGFFPATKSFTSSLISELFLAISKLAVKSLNFRAASGSVKLGEFENTYEVGLYLKKNNK